MSEYGEGDDNLDGTTAAASSADNSPNSSILEKVRTGVSNILPQSLSKWFSPSSKKSENAIGVKRRHNEINSVTPTITRRRIGVHNQQPENENDDDEETESIEETALNDEPQPTKRSRMSFDGSMMNSRSLVASTPATGMQRTNHYGRLNLPHGRNKREPAYNFFPPTPFGSTDIIDLIPIPISSGNREINNEQLTSMEPAGSRRNLNNYPLLNAPLTNTGGSNILPTLKRQSLSTVRDNSNTTIATTRQTIGNNNISLDPALELDRIILPQTQSQTEAAAAAYNGQTQFQNGINDDFDDELLVQQQRSSRAATESTDAEENDTSNTNLPILPIKRARLNITGGYCAEKQTTTTTTTKTRNNNNKPLTPGLYNMSASSANNSRNGSRNSLFGNGLNFDTHLEGRKSLFSRSNTMQTNASSSASTSRLHHNINNTLSNSTLSLNSSLSRRQFNASIYGSTSALSDSRLLNTTTTTTSSPFYKGNTTYGGANAYNKYPTSTLIANRTGLITPTIIRPTSSLSTLSSSNNSIGGAHHHHHTSSHLSLTSKTLLDAINELTTPISEAKKMGNSLLAAATRGKNINNNNRLSEADIQAERAIRLQRVTTPYSRKIVMLRPKYVNATTTSTTLPPIRELQVPSMSHILEMKRHNQNVTTLARQITMQTETTQNYAVRKEQQQQPEKETNVVAHNNKIVVDNVAVKKVATTAPSTDIQVPTTSIENGKQQQPQQLQQHQEPQQQKHISKIRRKINNTRNNNNLDFIENESSFLPVDLPNITLTDYISKMPKFDIDDLKGNNKTTNTTSNSPTTTTKVVIDNQTQQPKTTPLNQIKLSTTATTTSATKNLAFQFSPPDELKNAPLTTVESIKPAKIDFKFSAPITVKSTTNNLLTTPTTSIVKPTTTTVNTIKTPQQLQPSPKPILKTGSCLDALKKPLEFLPTTSKQPTTISFGEQFKKPANEWECDACMLRNKDTAEKCVACETPRTIKTTKTIATTPTTSTTTTSGFGNLFKKQSGEWECDACMVRNKTEALKCISCETVRKGSASSTTLTTSTTSGFGNLFQKQSGEWECEACMVRNKAEALKCISCETVRKGGATTATTNTFKQPDIGFKALAQAQASNTWECEVCTTRNDATRLKCVCCEQAKPGSTNTPQDCTAEKFNFGTTAATKFSFGFGGANKESELRTTTTATTIAKTETAKGFLFNNNNNATSSTVVSSTTATTTLTTAAGKTGSSNGFTFGFPAATSTTNDIADGGGFKPSGFVFGQAKATTSVATTTTGSTPTSTISGLNKQTATTTATVAATPLTFGGFGSSPKAVTSTSTTTTTLNTLNNNNNNKPDFTFGMLSKPKTTEATTTSTSLTTTTTVTSATSTMPAFTFGVKPPAATATATTTPTTETTKKPLLAFGATTTSTTTTAVPLATSTVATTTTVVAVAKPTPTFGSPSGFQFGSSNNPTTTKSLFGAAVAAAVAPSNSAPTTFGACTAKNLANSQNENQASNKTNTTTLTTTTSTTATPFGGFNFEAKSENNNNNLFGSMTDQTQPKPIASATPMFGNLQASSTANSTTTSATSLWPNSNSSCSTSLFGGMNTTNENALQPTAPPVFGNTPTPTATATSNYSQSIFGSSGSSSASQTSVPPPAFGSQKIVFGSSSSSSTANNTPNLFGAASNNNNNNNNNNANNLPQFGSNVNSAPPPAFGSSSNASATTFGGFNAPTTNQGNNANTNSQSNTATPFQFGAPAQNTNTGGFNFGAPTASRPAFNFTASNPPSFNFTGGSTENNQNTARPFQFGAPAPPSAAQQATAFNNNPTTMVFPFGGAPTTTETNTPFQFNAGNAATPANNIFAPQPSASNTAQSSAAARRRVRVPTRRLTPR